VYSEVDQGSVFKIYLPAATQNEGELASAPPAQMPADGSETILVIEDEDIVRNLACRGLKDHGYSVVEAQNGAEALEYMKEHPGSVDMVITDVVMPEMGGRELARNLAGSEPDLPVLFMSGYTGDDVVHRGLLDPGAPFQQKPFTPNGLATKVRAMLDQRQSRLPTSQ
jgi:CheY-like chemotaxis protein